MAASHKTGAIRKQNAPAAFKQQGRKVLHHQLIFGSYPAVYLARNDDVIISLNSQYGVKKSHLCERSSPSSQKHNHQGIQKNIGIQRQRPGVDIK